MTKLYDPEKHIPILYDVFSAGFGPAEFCSRSGISLRSFAYWIKKNKDFKEAYEIALAAGQALWEAYPRHVEMKNFCFQYWNLIYALRYKQASPLLKKLKDKSPTAKMKVAWNALSNGIISSQAFNLIASGVMTEVKIQEIQNQEKIMDTSEVASTLTDEALKAYAMVKSGRGKVVLNEQ